MSEEKKAPAPIQISHTYSLVEYNVVKKAKSSRALIGVENDKVVYIQTCEVQNQKFVIDNANISTEKESPLFVSR